MLTEEAVCRFCGSERRDRSQLCVVESPADLLAIEQSGAYRGSYFVLMGHLSPIDGIGPSELGLELLERRFAAERFAEVVLATSVTVEGDATAHLVAALAHKHGLHASRIAYGVPVGGELEFIDGGTWRARFSGRREIESASRRRALMSATESTCLFCKIVAGELPAERVYEDETVLAFKDIHPQAPFHCLVIPKAHVATLNDFTPEQAALIGTLLLTAKRIAADHGLPGYRVAMNVNREGGQVVFTPTCTCSAAGR